MNSLPTRSLVPVSSPTTSPPTPQPSPKSVMSSQAPLDIQAEFRRPIEIYNESPQSETVKVLLMGEPGTGKTSLLRTCPAPVVCFMFDPGGEKVLREEIRQGRVIPKIFSREDYKKPTVWESFDKEFHRLLNGGFFNHVGTVAIDSLTSLSDFIMSYILYKGGRPGGVPNRNTDYMPVKSAIQNLRSELLGLPCHVIMTAHPGIEKDDVSGRVSSHPMVVGDLKEKLTIAFDECWISIAKPGATKSEYWIQTSNDGYYKASSRLAQLGNFEKFERPDFKALLKKAGYSIEDKSLFNSSKQTEGSQS